MQQVSVQSSIVDVFEMLSWSIAVSVPSGRAASRKCCSVRGRAPTEPNICGRVNARRTGRPVCFAAIAQSTTCDQDEPLPPKPPPRNGEITCTSSGDTPSVFATAVRVPLTPWVESYSVSCGPSQCAMVACGSMGL
jgi:hypothetical protein